MPKRKSDEMKTEMKSENDSLLTDSEEEKFQRKPKIEKEKIKNEVIGSSDEEEKPKKVKLNLRGVQKLGLKGCERK